MSRLTLVLVALLGALVGGLGVSLYTRPAADDSAMRAVVRQVLSEQPPSAPVLQTVTQDQINPMIESYLMGDPKVLQRVSDKLEDQVRAETAEKSRVAITAMRDQIFSDPDSIVIGNPQGDVTLVEMFDYNCSFCRGALPDLATLLAEDPNLRVVLKEFPILSQQSVEAARVAVLVGQSHKDYWSFHQALFTGRGVVDADAALKQAEVLGLDPAALKGKMQDDTVTAVIQKSYDLAKALNVTGTPSYIVGDELIQGAVGIDKLRTSIANMRQCGKTDCQG